MNARDIIKLAAKLYIDDYLKKKTTILANAERRIKPTVFQL
jgi:hypothetical protein